MNVPIRPDALARPDDDASLHPPRHVQPFGLFMVAFCLCVCGLVFIPQWVAAAERDRILETGMPATATVLELVDTGNRYNNNPEVVMHLEVHRKDGVVYQTSLEFVPSIVDLANYSVGGKLEVRIDPRDDDAVAIVGPRAGAAARSASAAHSPVVAPK